MTKNMKFDSKITLNKDPLILDLAPTNNHRVCLQYDRVVCFAKNKNNEDPERKMREITQELKRKESESRRQSRTRTIKNIRQTVRNTRKTIC